MQTGPMTTQPRVPLFCKGSEKVNSGDSAKDWQREEDGRTKKTFRFEETQNLPSKIKNRVATELPKS